MKNGSPFRSANAAASTASTSRTSKNSPKTEFIASKAAAIPLVVFRKSRRVKPNLRPADSADTSIRRSTAACAGVWGSGRNSSFETIRVGIGDRVVIPFLIPGRTAKRYRLIMAIHPFRAEQDSGENSPHVSSGSCWRRTETGETLDPAMDGGGAGGRVDKLMSAEHAERSFLKSGKPGRRIASTGRALRIHTRQPSLGMPSGGRLLGEHERSTGHETLDCRIHRDRQRGSLRFACVRESSHASEA